MERDYDHWDLSDPTNKMHYLPPRCILYTSLEQANEAAEQYNDGDYLDTKTGNCYRQSDHTEELPIPSQRCDTCLGPHNVNGLA